MSNKHEKNPPESRAKRWMGEIGKNTRVIDRYPMARQLELIPQEVDVQKVEKHIGKAEREVRDKAILKFIGLI